MAKEVKKKTRDFKQFTDKKAKKDKVKAQFKVLKTKEIEELEEGGLEVMALQIIDLLMEIRDKP